MKIFLVGVCLMLGVHNGLAYNLEKKLPLFKYGIQGSKFGHSIALHTINDDVSGNELNTLMVVGAPRAEYETNDVSEVDRPKYPGGIFYCPITTRHGDCSRVSMDKGGNSYDSAKKINYTKDDQWLGVSLKSQGPGKFLVTCAHRYRQIIRAGDPEKEVERMCGKCFLLKAQGESIVEPDSEDLPSEFVSSVCDMYPTGTSTLEHKNRYGPMQTGTSIDVTANDYVLGAPGTWAWTGAIFDFALPTGDNDRSDRYYETPTCYSGQRVDTEYGLWRCKEFPVKRDSYVGLSIATSTAVDTDEDTMYYAAGTPRGNQTGAVVFFKRGNKTTGTVYSYMDGYSELTPDSSKTVYNTKVHSSFGYAVALTDINGDGLDDLIVGAPQFYADSRKLKAGGAVYIYLNQVKNDFGSIAPKEIYGQSDSYFGHSVAALGDIDQDGFNDFAVGAPYEGENGAVHIYRGGKNGPKLSEIIKGSDYDFVDRESQPLVGFGTSLSGNVDADGNNYPDLLIGASSDTIALFRSRPIISVAGELDVDTEVLNLEMQDCRYRRKSHSCFRITYCVSYTARHARYEEGVPISYKINLDAMSERRPRLVTNPPLVGNVTLPEAGRRVCIGNRQRVYFEDENADKLTDIELSFAFDLNNPEVKRESEGDPVFKMINDPILDADLDNVLKKTVKIKNTCGDDGCQSNLVVQATMDYEIFVGEDKNIMLNVTVENLGEEAHQAYLMITIPEKVRFDDFVIDDPSTPTMRCHEESESQVKCFLGNPYMPGMKDKIMISLTTGQLDADTKAIEVAVAGHTTSENPKLVPIRLEALVFLKVDLAFTAYGTPQQVRYERRDIIGASAVEKPSDIGGLLTYNYIVSNEGLQPVNDISINVELPIEIFNGKWLLYPFNADIMAGNTVAGSCNTTNINTLEVPSDGPSAAASTRGRNKRSASEDDNEPVAAALVSAPGKYRSGLTLDCGNSRCARISCRLDEINVKTSSSLQLQIRLWDATLLEEYPDVDLINIRSSATLESDYKNVRYEDEDNIAVRIQTTVDHGKLTEDDNRIFPWWYILIAVIILLIFYVLVVLLFIKHGFFKRKKYHREKEVSVGSDDQLVKEDRRDEDEL